MIAPTCARCWRGSRTAGSCASTATRTSRSPPASPAPRSTATPSWCIRPSGSRRRCAGSGAKGEGEFAPIGWDEALDEIVARWQAIIAESGPLALLGYAYSAHQGQINRGLVNGLFHALGASRLRAGTVCDTCCETAWDMTVGAGRRRRPGIGRPRRSDRLLGRRSRRHQRAFLGQGRDGAKARRRARRHRPAPEPHRAPGRLAPADPHRHRRGLGAGGHAHPGARRAVRPRLHRPAHARLRAARSARSCRVFRPSASPRSPASRSPTSSVSRRSTAGPRRRSSASARA